MRLLLRLCLPATLIVAAFSAPPGMGQPPEPIHSIRMPSYSVEVAPGEPPRLTIQRDGETVFEVPVVGGAGLRYPAGTAFGIDYSVRGRRRLGV